MKKVKTWLAVILKIAVTTSGNQSVLYSSSLFCKIKTGTGDKPTGMAEGKYIGKILLTLLKHQILDWH